MALFDISVGEHKSVSCVQLDHPLFQGLTLFANHFTELSIGDASVANLKIISYISKLELRHTGYLAIFSQYSSKYRLC